MHSTALQSRAKFSLLAHTSAERSVEQALDADMVAALAWGRMRLAQERLRHRVHGSLRRIICWKLLAGRLPLDSAPTLIAHPGTGDLCGVCERPLRPAHMVVDVPSGETFVHLHADCFVLWDDERRKVASLVTGAD